ncbi:MAG: spore coat U domain-containing protein [Thermoanaerobaculia bacterium]
MKKTTVLSFVALLPLFALVPRADALTCTFGSITGVNFGPYDVLGASAVKSTGTITYSCTNVGTRSVMVINLSTGTSGTFANRTLRSGANILNYNLYSTAANTQVWGDGNGTTYQYSIDPTDKNAHTLTVYGTIPAGQDVGVGSYTDTITITMNF